MRTTATLTHAAEMTLITAAAQRRSRSARKGHAYHGEKHDWAKKKAKAMFFYVSNLSRFLLQLFSTIVLFFVLLRLIWTAFFAKTAFSVTL